MLSPARAYAALRRRGSSRVTALWLTGWQLLAWLLLRLEQPAWRYLLNARGLAHLEHRAPRPGDPLRYLIQGGWLLLVRPRPERGVSIRTWLRKGLAWLRRRREQQQRWLRSRLFRSLAGSVSAPRAVRSRAWWRERGRSKRRLTIWVILGLALMLALLGVTQPFDYTAQLLFVVVLWSLAMVVRRLPGRFPTLLMIVLSVLISCRYLWWRYSSTLNWNDGLDLALGLTLLLAETYSWLILLLGYVQTCWPLKRPPAPLPADTRLWPSVDLMIPTYNEPLSVVRTTVYAALGIDWPADKLNIYILDDGRRMDFRRFAEEAGVGYIARTDNRHAKAGNLNHALKQTSGELVAIFDCDHVPVRSFLQLTAGGFLQDPRLALVQTPHHFFSPDPVERNLGLFRRSPNEGELFYGLVQDGNDMWNATFFCGSCALLRRSALEEIGGIAVETVTEDAHTALRLHRRGWNSAYMRIPQAAGLATESLSAHVGQRIRWARGMAQIFRIDNPLLGKGLTLFQRLCYANAMLHFLAGVPRLVFLLAPLAFLLLHAYIIYAPAILLLLYVLPHMMHSSLTAARMQGRYRRTFWGEVYETVLAWYIARPTMVALLAPSKGAFNVTAKGGLMEQAQFDWRIARPYLVLALLNLAGLGLGVWRFIYGPAAEQGTVVVTSLWVLYNLLIIGAAVAIAAETRQVRQSPRVRMRLPATLRLPGGHLYSGVLLDYSDGGVAIRVPGVAALTTGSEVSLLLRRGEREHVFPGVVSRSHDHVLGIHFARLSREQRIDFVQCTFARADAWLDWLEPRRERPLQSLLEVFAVGGRGYARLWRFLPRRLRFACEPLLALLRWLGSFLPRWPQARTDSEQREWTAL
ncbi:UDP-forming cellulose synthase catalytic subunit [Oceanimonas doudoroffii]|uniref:Cellulose synthase catalytic subunit [UDP-forming] n=1 Tax=Oceanimonas doudoroffii TaxID=84158 RepID=A0A233RJ48_9GAMM|nr:UDP-forming cellulose synthase catalytic subunit [Oceanimonas doudoroffii]OXY83414.1 UDP-forming cellulose synthase catalytic subunit [Oceanimonas doudoroffii]